MAEVLSFFLTCNVLGVFFAAVLVVLSRGDVASKIVQLWDIGSRARQQIDEAAREYLATVFDELEAVRRR